MNNTLAEKKVVVKYSVIDSRWMRMFKSPAEYILRAFSLHWELFFKDLDNTMIGSGLFDERDYVWSVAETANEILNNLSHQSVESVRKLIEKVELADNISHALEKIGISEELFNEFTKNCLDELSLAESNL